MPKHYTKTPPAVKKKFPWQLQAATTSSKPRTNFHPAHLVLAGWTASPGDTSYSLCKVEDVEVIPGVQDGCLPVPFPKTKRVPLAGSSNLRAGEGGR